MQTDGISIHKKYTHNGRKIHEKGENTHNLRRVLSSIEDILDFYSGIRRKRRKLRSEPIILQGFLIIH